MKKGLLQSIFTPLMNAYDRFNLVMLDGHYGADQRAIWDFLFKSSRDETPSAAPMVAGNKLFSMSAQTIAQRYILPSVIAVLSLQLQMAAVVVIGGAVAGLFAFEYLRCKRLRNDTISEVNVAGQTVRGKRGDLARLHRAQANILDLASAFRMASVENTTDTIHRIIKSVEAERSRIQIMESGHWQAGTDMYHFSRPVLDLVETDADGMTKHASLPMRGQLQTAFSNPLTQDDVVTRMLALERALPDGLRKSFRDQLQQNPLPATVAAPANDGARKPRQSA